MTHLDLFSGIGGFAYAVDQVWDDVEHIFCDNEPFAREVIKKHWPESEIYDDIKAITSDTLNTGLERQLKEKSKRQLRQPSRARQDEAPRPFILTGGFPCQPFSAAGARRGTGDNRYLWPEMLRVIRLTQPQWVIAENVNGILTIDGGMVFEQVCLDLEAAGYEIQPFVIPAVAKNAPHRRDRVWIVAHANNSGRHSVQRGVDNRNPSQKPTRKNEVWESGKGNNNAENPISLRGRRRNEGSGQILERQSSEIQDQRPSWESDWIEIATQFCSVDDGLPVELDGFELSKPKHRKEQLKAYGNAIVPQVAVEIMKGIKQS